MFFVQEKTLENYSKTEFDLKKGISLMPNENPIVR